MNNLRIEKKIRDQPKSEYVCDNCGMSFGNSLGDMELHKTLVHLQNGDISADSSGV